MSNQLDDLKSRKSGQLWYKAGKNPKLKTKDLLGEALAYCEIDSWVTVIFYDILKNVYLGTLKLDAKIIN